MNKKKLLLAGAIVILFVLFFLLDLGRFLTLAYLQDSLDRFHEFYAQNRFLTLSVFFAIYVLVTTLSLPGAAVMTLAAGAFFGLVIGVILVSFASSIGATLAFLVARFLLRDKALGVDVKKGHARLVSPWEVEIAGEQATEKLSARSIVIATGGKPMAPPIPGLDQVDYLTSDTLWKITDLPDRLLVLGGGPIGCELAQSFARLGSDVTLVEMGDRLLSREDKEASDLLVSSMKLDGVDLRLGYRATAFETDSNGTAAIIENSDGQVRVYFDKVLVALGRKGHTEKLGLKNLGIELRQNGTLVVNDYLETRFPNILACGDVAGPYQFTHTAAHQAWFAAVNALFGRFKRFKVDYRVIPWCTFTTPEVARVGINEQEAKEREIPGRAAGYPDGSPTDPDERN